MDFHIEKAQLDALLTVLEMAKVFLGLLPIVFASIIGLIAFLDIKGTRRVNRLKKEQNDDLKTVKEYMDILEKNIDTLKADINEKEKVIIMLQQRVLMLEKVEREKVPELEQTIKQAIEILIALGLSNAEAIAALNKKLDVEEIKEIVKKTMKDQKGD